MPSESVAEFLELARGLQLFTDADVNRIAEEPEAEGDLPQLIRRQVDARLLTRYQADRILTGRGYTLGYAGFVRYDVLDDVTDLAFEPTTRTEVLLSRSADKIAQLERTLPVAIAGPTTVGTHGGEWYAVHRKPEGAHLASLVSDMGPMPPLLAAEYTRQAAAVLAATHAGGGIHGRIRPHFLFVGPLVQASKPKADGSPRFRPGPTATVCITGYGLPVGDHTADDDVSQLGGVLFHLLTGRAPGETSLSMSRPDSPPELVILVNEMLALAPADRPSMTEVASRLTAMLSPGQSDAEPLGNPANPGMSPADVTLAETEQVELMEDSPQLALAGGWAGHPAVAASPPAFTPPVWVPPQAPAHHTDEPHPEEPYTPRRARPSGNAASTRKMIWLLAGAFVLINVLAVLVWVLLLAFPVAKK